MEMEKTMQNAKAANRLFNALSKPKTSESDLLVDSTYKSDQPHTNTQKFNTKQSYTARKYLNRSNAVEIIQQDIQENTARAELKNQEILAKFMKKEKSKYEKPVLSKSDLAGIADNDKDVDTNFFSFENTELTPNEVLGTLDEMGVDRNSKRTTSRLPNPFDKFGNEDEYEDDIGPMAYTVVS